MTGLSFKGIRPLVFPIQWHLYIPIQFQGALLPPPPTPNPCLLSGQPVIIILAFKQDRPEFY